VPRNPSAVVGGGLAAPPPQADSVTSNAQARIEA